jgi:protoporphyrinogen/coproporphyrinogen III oxidase
VKKDVVIVGAGISGLSCAFSLKKMGLDVMLCEKTDRVGGVIRSVEKEGFLMEEGPNSLMGLSPDLMTIIEGLNLNDDLLKPSNVAQNRYVYRRGKIHKLPTGLWSFMTSSLLSIGSKLRVLQEPFITQGRGEETIGQFFQKRIGPEATRILVDSFVSGIYAGDIDQLSASACFPRLVELENKHRSLFLGLLRQSKSKRKDRSLFTFKKGLEQLPLAMESWLKKSIFKKYHILSLEKKTKDFHSVVFETPDGEKIVEARSVIFATPSYITAETLQRFDARVATELLKIPYTPLCVLHLGFKKEAFSRVPEGFGFLVPRSQRKRTLGVLWSSSMFENRAPKDHVLLTAMVGGALDHTAYSDTLLINQVVKEISYILKISKPPVFIHEKRHMKALPQYNIGHIKKCQNINNSLVHSPGLFITGNYIKGVSTVDCIDEGAKIATQVQSYLSS